MQQQVKNKTILAGLLLLVILLSSFVSANRAPSFLERLGNSWGYSASNWWPFDKSRVYDGGPADIYNWYNGTFFTLEPWEMAACLLDFTTDVRELSDSTFNIGTGDDYVYDTTMTINAKKQPYNATESLYKVSWYILPYDMNFPYRVYFIDNDDKDFFIPNDNKVWRTATMGIGDSGYEAFYSSKKFVRAGIEYNDTDTKRFEVSIGEEKV
ncbi:hypothetical protein JW756_00720 [Candidatus Woesearchaeota archaeon]|nr:hypothetical protein [Candidatus Woesearchaeota archaeon]